MRDHPLLQLVVIMVPLSLLSIGGGGAILAPLHDASVNVHGWMSSREFVDMFAISRTCPGPGAVLVALIGMRVYGWFGAITATIAIFLPSAMLCFYAARVWNRYRGTRIHTVLERGLTPVGTGLTLAGALQILNASQTGYFGLFIAGVATALMLWRNFHPMILLGVGGSLFVLLAGASA